MCFGGQDKPEPTAGAPAPPLEAPDPVEIGDTRKQETRKNFGSDQPTYRVKRQSTVTQVTPADPIRL